MMDTENGLKCAVYVRVSTDKQEVQNQIQDLVPYAHKMGWEIVDRYVDVISGTKDKRPGFDLLFADAHKLKFDIVLFWALDRISRKGTVHTISKLKELDNLNIRWHSYTEPYVSTLGPWKDMIISVLATLAKIERDKISERTKAGLARAKAEGRKLGGQCRKYNFKRIWAEYEKEGSVTRASKILDYSYGTIQYIITNKIHDQDTYQKMKERDYYAKKGEIPHHSRGGGKNDNTALYVKPSSKGPMDDNGVGE